MDEESLQDTDEVDVEGEVQTVAKVIYSTFKPTFVKAGLYCIDADIWGTEVNGRYMKDY
jgi:hypothetical protein